MNKFILSIITCVSLVLSACSDWEEEPIGKPKQKTVNNSQEEPQNEENPENSTEEPPGDKSIGDDPSERIVDVIFEQEIISKKTFVDQVKAGDTVVIQLVGDQRTRKFSEVYEKVADSVWFRKECENESTHPDPFTRGGVGGNSVICVDFPEHGKCQMFFRDYVGEVSSSIEFAEEPENIPLRFIIGDKLYRIDKITVHEGTAIEVELQIRSGMVQESDEIYLKPVNELGDSIKTGFVEYGRCEGWNHENFHVNEPTESRSMPNSVSREFQVDLAIIRNGGE